MEIEVFKELDRDLTDLLFSEEKCQGIPKCAKAMTVSERV